MTPARFRWGMMLILIGVLLLLRNADVINDNFWGDLLIWFPIVLIAVGIEKIFARSRLKVISYITTILLVFAGLAIALAGSMGGRSASYFNETTYRLEKDESISLIRAVLELDGTDITIRDSGGDLVYGRFDELTQKPKISYEKVDDVAELEFVSRDGSFLGGAVKINTNRPQDWSLRFSRDIPLELECYGDNNDMHLNMSTTPLRLLTMIADNASIYLKIGELEKKVSVSIEGDESDLRLRLPRSIGIQLQDDEYRTYLESIGLKLVNGFFVNDEIDSTINFIELELDDRLDGFSIEFF